jgi:4-hydroxy-3-methylbut-2-en-1-yl diphosphate reductase
MSGGAMTPESRSLTLKRILLASPRGFCAGVVRAVEIVDLALDCFEGPVYVRREIVHNRHVVADFEARGVRFVRELDEVPDGATAVFSAHGVSPEVREAAVRRRLRVIDATCPLVTKVHLEAIRFARMDYDILLVGHAGHEEVEGTMGEAASQIRLVSSVAEAESIDVKDPERVAFITQTTLSMEDTRPIVETLRRRFPKIQSPAKDDICYATQNRQVAVRALAKQAPLILVVGSSNSSNSNRLVEEAQLAGARAYLVDDVSQIDPAWLEGVETVGITSGASAPDFLVEEIVRRFGGRDAVDVEEVLTVEESVHFPLPPEVSGARRPGRAAVALPTRS